MSDIIPDGFIQFVLVVAGIVAIVIFAAGFLIGKFL
ncbi:hypothetical protein Dip510_000848 [Elusimicrobium posterum]